MNTHILIFSCVHDLEYLEYCLKSIQKFCTGFTGVTIVIHAQEYEYFDDFAPHYGAKLREYEGTEDKRFWHILHQGEKCRADLYVPPDTDFIWFLDSDCFLIKPTTPENYFVEGKPVMLVEEYATMKEMPWKEQTSKALGIDAKFETMRVHGAMHYLLMFPEFRFYMEELHKRPFLDYVLNGGQPTFPWHFSEFNALGNYVLTSVWKDKYHIRDVGKNGYPDHHLIDVWSHAPITAAQPNRYRGLFPDAMTVQQIYDKLGF